MGPRYDPKHIAGFFDAYGEREWARFEQSAADRVSLHLHRHYLERFVAPGMHVLDAGAGPGRFTIALAELGARVTVGDISPVQLEHNRQRLTEVGLEEAVVARVQLDVTDLSHFGDGAFDAVVCYGGPISYAMDKGDKAVAELLRVMKPGGYGLFSVMSKVGAMRIFLPGVFAEAREHGTEYIDSVLATGLLPKELNRGHAMKLYTHAEFRGLLERHGAEVVVASAANHLCAHRAGAEDVVDGLWERDMALWQKLLAWELAVCAEPGALDGGTHIIAVVTRR
jgi:ubiquinone/menaquinone biosynthesis C-methylase UbiE